MSVKINNGIKISATATIIPNGFIETESVIFPFIRRISERVMPHEGQGMPVTFLNRHNVNLSFVMIKCL